jgi:hypothetical protein
MRPDRRMTMQTSRLWIPVIAGVLAFAALPGCGDDDSDDDGDGGNAGTGGSAGGSGGKGGSGGSSGTSTGGTAGTSAGGDGEGGGATEMARVRVMHLSPDAPNVDVFVDEGATPVVENLEFPEGTEYLEVPPGTSAFDVAATGGSAADAVLTIPDLELEAGESYTAIAFDELANVQALALVDDYADLASGEIRVRAIHTAVGVGQVDIWNVPESGEPAPLWTDLDFGTAGEALDLDAGAYTVGIDVDDDEMPDLTFELPDLDAGTVVNVFAVADSDENVFLIVELPSGDTARIDPN